MHLRLITAESRRFVVSVVEYGDRRRVPVEQDEPLPAHHVKVPQGVLDRRRNPARIEALRTRKEKRLAGIQGDLIATRDGGGLVVGSLALTAFLASSAQENPKTDPTSPGFFARADSSISTWSETGTSSPLAI